MNWGRLLKLFFQINRDIGACLRDIKFSLVLTLQIYFIKFQRHYEYKVFINMKGNNSVNQKGSHKAMFLDVFKTFGTNLM